MQPVSRVISFIILFAELILLTSCHSNKDILNLLDKVDSYIEHYPDSALNALQSIDQSQLGSAKAQAKYSLLLSMAFDKNYIDTTDFSVLQPAIDYYTHKGSATDKLRMYYYKGAIYRNLNDEESAMAAFVKGLYEGKLSNDNLTRARMLFAQGKIYRSIFDFKSHNKCMLEAANLFKLGGKESSWFNSHRGLFYGYFAQSDSVNAFKELKYMASIVDTAQNVNWLNQYYEALVTYRFDYEKDSVAGTILEYVSNVPAEKVEWLTIAVAYCKISKYKRALEAIENYKSYIVERPIRFYSILSEIYENLEDYKKSLLCYKKYFLNSDSISLVQIREDTQFIEERYNYELQSAKKENSRNIILLTSISVILLLIFLAVSVRNRLRLSYLKNRLLEAEKEKLERSYLLLEDEMSSLKELLDADSLIKNGVEEIIKDRISLLNQLFIARIRDDRHLLDKVDSIIDNRKEFMHSLLLQFKSTHPQFISYLEKKNLTEFEMEHCCLLAIGMNGKDIGVYTNQSRHYHISSCIREKLGSDISNTNLNTYISHLLRAN